MRQQLETEQKALEINLDQSVYGTFAEIGAGQEVARYFFQVGAAAGTIAKTMSAYDKVYSDEIYGRETSGRYVCESRLYKMLDHEYDLLHSRLQLERPNSRFFVFADTISAINFHRTNKGHGWLGIRFQLDPEGEPNDLVLHVRMLDKDNQLQQQAIGILGVNLIYACYQYAQDPEELLQSLMDSLKERVEIDMVRLTGPDFEHLDNRLVSLLCVKQGLTSITMFDSNGQSVHPSEFLYKKYVMVFRGSFRPPTLTHVDMINTGYSLFKANLALNSSKTYLLTEISLDSLSTNQEEIDHQDFLDRSILLNALGHTVVISNSADHQGLLTYLSDYKVQQLAVVLEAHKLLELINQKYYANQDGRLIAAFGELFTHKVRVYTYPSLQEGSEELMMANNLPVPEGVKFLYKHLLDNGQIIDIPGFNAEVLPIYTKQVYEMLQQGEVGWEEFVPKKVSQLIKNEYLFGYPREQLSFDY